MIDLDGLDGRCAPTADLMATRSYPPPPGSYRSAQNVQYVIYFGHYESCGPGGGTCGK